MRPLLLLLLDGVAFDRVRAVYARGAFRRFRPPSRVIAPFPTLTDPCYDLLFGCGPTPGYEAGHFDRDRNHLHFGLLDYVRGRNEAWVRHVDFRLNFLEDAIMYLAPRYVFRSELRRARRVLDRRLRTTAAGPDAPSAQRRPSAALYILSTDGLGHMLPPAEIEAELERLARWVEDIFRDYPQLEMVMLSDHGLATLPPGLTHVQRFDLAGVLTAAGLRIRPCLRESGDVVLPMLGLLDVARVFTFDAETRSRASAALRARLEIELVVTRADDGHLTVCAGPAQAYLTHARAPDGTDLYGYFPQAGDPLRLRPALERLAAAGNLASVPGVPLPAAAPPAIAGLPALPAGFATAAAWLAASAELAYPAAPSRLWQGLHTLCREQPDVVVSLTDRWFAGSGLLSGFVRMQGTHGGLHRRVSETFVMGTDLDFPPVTDLPGIADSLRTTYGWPYRDD